MKEKNTFLISILAVLGVFTILYFAVASKVSYAFSYDEEKARYDSKISAITDLAVIYGEKNKDLFTETDTIYITVSDLVEKGLLEADDNEGNVKDPTSDVKTLNSLKIRINHTEEKYEATVLFD